MKARGKKVLTLINDKWQIAWGEGVCIAHRNLLWYEFIFYFPKMFYYCWIGRLPTLPKEEIDG